VPLHFPVPLLLPCTRPDASRSVPVNVPDGLMLPEVLPVRRPEASRYWVCTLAPVPPLFRVAAVAVSLPLASR